jgi:glycosyltransferase involved in cell wall biosynthesis
VSFEVRVPESSRPAIALSANTAWFITNFCGALIKGLTAAGYRPIAVAPADAAGSGALESLGAEFHSVRIDRSGVNPVADLRLLGEYRRLLAALRPAAYLGFTIKPNIYGSIAARQSGIPSIATVSGLGTAFIRSGPLQTVVTGLYRFAFRNAATVFFQNQDDRSLFVKRRLVCAAQARVIPGLGIDLDRFGPAALPAGPPIFLLIARLLRDKGVAEFVEGARMLRLRLPGARFQLLGPIDHDNRTAITSGELAGWVEEGVVEYLGATDDVRPFIAGASAIVLPSYREGMPRALLEGAAMGRPLIAADVAGCRDVVEDGVNGYLHEVRDAASLADAMERLANLPSAQRSAMGAAARRKVQQRFSDEIVVREYLDLLAAVAPASQRTPC